jgi:uncharacterized protein YndB with AHSA1/START domain
MTIGFEAIKTLTIDARPAKVWQALTDPDQVREYMHGTNLATDWRAGSPITWSGEWKGKAYVDKGVVLEIRPDTRLSYTHWSPLGGSPDRPENYHTVSFDLVDGGGSTTLTLTQDNNPTQAEADAMADKNWGPMLVGLKATAERR